MDEKKVIVLSNYFKAEIISCDELCKICNVSTDFVKTLIAYEIISPETESQDQWVFELSQLKQVQRAIRLQQDLEMNLASIAVVLELQKEVEDLRKKLEIYERHYL